ncbi:HAD family hydrolase [Sphingomonas daechungensis]|uniref:HAD family hydrolase n=1 Tax=Sphingomonas daechungensis TaxID=1176646 RepID=UPI003784EC2B
MSIRFPPEAIIFDLDGTLVDTAADIVAALDALLGEYGRSAVGEAAGRSMIGDGARVLIERGFAATGGPVADMDAAQKRWFEIYSADIARHSKPYPGVVETLAKLRSGGIALGVCTNKADAPTHLLLESLDLKRYFTAVVGGDVAHRKPDPRHLFATVGALGSAPDRALMVGDSPNDAKAAHAARIRLILVDYGYSNEPVHRLGADTVLSDFAGLLEIVA